MISAHVNALVFDYPFVALSARTSGLPATAVEVGPLYKACNPRPVNPFYSVRALLFLAIVFAGVYIAVLVFLYFFQTRLIYFPEKDIRATPQSLGLSYEDITVTVGSETVDAWFVPADSAATVVLYCHGNGGNLSDWLGPVHEIHAAGLSVLAFDYRGYGRSNGKPSETGTYEDADACFAWLLARGYSEDRIIVYGRSLGAAVAAHVARDKRIQTLVLEASFTKLADAAALHYPWVPVRLLLRHHYPTDLFIQDARSPVVIIHSRQDELNPFWMAEKLYELAPQPKRLIATQGGHNDFTAVDWADITDRTGP